MKFNKILPGGRGGRVDRVTDVTKLAVAFRMQASLNKRIEELSYASLVFHTTRLLITVGNIHQHAMRTYRFSYRHSCFDPHVKFGGP
jgi:hypothetical protein